MMLFHWRSQYLIECYLAGTLSPQERVEFETHLQDCSKCQQKLAEERSLSEQIIEAAKLTEPLPGSWDRLHDKIRQLPRHPVPRNEIVTPVKDKNIFDILKTPRLAFATVILIVLLNLVFWFYYSLPRLSPITIAEIQGNSVWCQKNGSGSWVKMEKGERLNPKDIIHTDEFTQVSIRVGNSGKLWLDHSSEINLFSQKSAILNLARGQAYVSLNHLKPGYRFQVPAGFVEIQGTEFNLSLDTIRRTVITCSLHTVVFENAYGIVTVPAGFQSTVDSQTIPPLPNAVELQLLLFWKTQFDNFTKLNLSDREKMQSDYIYRGNQDYLNKKYNSALENYRYAVYLTPNFNAYYGMGKVHRELKNYALAKSAYEHSLELDGKSGPALYQLAECLLELKEYASAERIVNKLVAEYPENHAGWILLGRVYLLQGEREKAKSAFQKGIQYGARDCPECYFYLTSLTGI